MWLCVVAVELIMLSVGLSRDTARLPLSSCRESHYNHATGEFVVVPGEELKFSHFPLSPREALELLRILNPSTITTHTRN